MRAADRERDPRGADGMRDRLATESGRGAPATRWIAAGALMLGFALFALAVTRPIGAESPPMMERVYPDTLPAGTGVDIAGRACILCHATTLIVQQRKDSTAWEKTLTQMSLWGAPLVAEERDTLRAYLVEHFGPRP